MELYIIIKIIFFTPFSLLHLQLRSLTIGTANITVVYVTVVERQAFIQNQCKLLAAR